MSSFFLRKIKEKYFGMSPAAAGIGSIKVKPQLLLNFLFYIHNKILHQAIASFLFLLHMSMKLSNFTYLAPHPRPVSPWKYS